MSVEYVIVYQGFGSWAVKAKYPDGMVTTTPPMPSFEAAVAYICATTGKPVLIKTVTVEG